jgi:hypothetical protein
MKVLADHHHHDLWESLELLCARLGWTLYRPIGMDWFDQGYWNHERKWHGDAIAKQYLTPWGSDLPVKDGHSQRLDHSHGRFQRLVTLDAARDLRPDIVISTLAHNHEGFARFASEVGATFGLQIGNVRFGAQDMAEDRWDLAAFGLVSGIMPVEPPKPHVVYHQEFQIADTLVPGFRPEPPPRGDRLSVASFVQCYPESPTYVAWTAMAPQVPEMDWKVYGAYGGAPIDEWAAGNIDRCSDVASAMRASDIAWHAKAWSDGYGHVIHNWFAVGRPVFGFEGYYRDQLAGALWVDGVTSIDIERRSHAEVIAELRRIRDDEDHHLRMCEASAARFREVVNFDEEEQAIRRLFAQVLP